MRMAAHTELWCGSSIASDTGWLRTTGFDPVGARDGQSPTFLSLSHMSRTRQTPTVRKTPVLPAPSKCMHQYENRQSAQGISATRCLMLSCSSFNERMGADKLLKCCGRHLCVAHATYRCNPIEGVTKVYYKVVQKIV